MKRERDEVMTSKMELAIENKRLKVTDYFVKFIMPNRMKLKHLRKILMNNNLTVKDTASSSDHTQHAGEQSFIKRSLPFFGSKSKKDKEKSNSGRDNATEIEYRTVISDL
jgi:hypothetical protein